MIETIEIWDRAYAHRLSVFPADTDNPDLVAEGLQYTKNAIGGDATCTFTVKRDPRVYHKDLEDNNKVHVVAGGMVVWQGEIEGVDREVGTEYELGVECVGNCAKLKQNGTTANVAFNLAPNERLSNYIVDHILTDTNLDLYAGVIDSGDFQIVSGLEFYPGKHFWDILEEGNRFNGWRWRVRDRYLDYKKKDTTPKYHVRLADCQTSNLKRTREPVCNWVQYAYSADGSIYGYATSEDTASQEKHGMRRRYEAMSGNASLTEAQQCGDVLIAENKDLKPSSSLTTDVIRDSQGRLIPACDLDAGEVLQIDDLLTTEESIASSFVVNESDTWEVNELRVQGGLATFMPGGFATTLDILMAKIEARQRMFG